jgi:hypothetical protein
MYVLKDQQNDKNPKETVPRACVFFHMRGCYSFNIHVSCFFGNRHLKITWNSPFSVAEQKNEINFSGFPKEMEK